MEEIKKSTVKTVLETWWVWVLIGLVVLVLLAVLINPVASLLLFLLKVVWAIVSAPFRFIGWVVQKIRERRNN